MDPRWLNLECCLRPTVQSFADQSDGADDGWGAGSGAGGWWTHPDRPQASWPDMVLYDGAQMEQVATMGEVGPGKFVEGSTTTGKWFQGTRLHVSSNPNGSRSALCQ